MKIITLISLIVALVPCSTSAQEAGWTTFTVSASDSYAQRYLPASVDPEARLPAVVFLHGSGAAPFDYHSFLEDAAELAGCVLVMPKSVQLAGWGDALDGLTIDESLRIIGEELDLDQDRISVAGHSSGGAYAAWLAYSSGRRFSAVFTLAAPFLTISSNQDPDRYAAPIRLYYGTNDPNYQFGAWTAYLSQWQDLDIPWQLDVQAGYGHNTWPDSSMAEGLAFLVTHQRPDGAHPWRPDHLRAEDPSRTSVLN